MAIGKDAESAVEMLPGEAPRTGYSRRCKIMTVCGVLLAAAAAGGIAAAVILTKDNGSNSSNMGAITGGTTTLSPSGTSSFVVSSSSWVATTLDVPTITGTYTLDVTSTVLQNETTTSASTQTASVTSLVTTTETTLVPTGTTTTPAATTTVGPVAPTNPAGPCPVVDVDLLPGQCFDDLAGAIAAAPASSTITVRKNGLVITKEIPIETDLTIQGDLTTPITMYANMNEQWGGMFRATGAYQKIVLKDIIFERQGDGDASVLRTPDLGNAEQSTDPTTTLELEIHHCAFNGFKTHARGGSAIFVGQTTRMVIDNSLFQNNVVEKNGIMWEGGGSVSVKYAIGPVTVTNTRFLNNEHRFEHGMGAGFFVEFLIDNASLRVTGCEFTGNVASAGAALRVGTLESSTTTFIDSKFENNEAREFGWGSRGGALWLQKIVGSVEIRGSFINNRAPADRGGAIANNQILGPVTVSAEFVNNLSFKGGSVWDSLSMNTAAISGAGKLTFDAGCKFSGNTANGTRRIINVNGIKAYQEGHFKGQPLVITPTGATEVPATLAAPTTPVAAVEAAVPKMAPQPDWMLLRGY